MVKHADVTITAWDGNKLVGVARSISDFAYCTYLSDIAVNKQYQKLGIGRQMIEKTREVAGKDVNLFLFSAPQAIEYYPKVGFEEKMAFIYYKE